MQFGIHLRSPLKSRQDDNLESIPMAGLQIFVIGWWL